jgi:hypothetical protein
MFLHICFSRTVLRLLSPGFTEEVDAGKYSQKAAQRPLAEMKNATCDLVNYFSQPGLLPSFSLLGLFFEREERRELLCLPPVPRWTLL